MRRFGKAALRTDRRFRGVLVLEGRAGEAVRVIEGTNDWFCEALRARECRVVSGNGLQLCEGALQRDCGLAAASSRWMCVILQDEFGGA